jgi:uncharacterized protein with PIN domain
MMKCPKCDGELRIVKASVVEDFVEVDLACNKDEEHIFFSRLHEEDLLEAN